MSQSDQSAAAAIVRHYAELSAALGELAAELIIAAEIGGLRPAYTARDALVGWVRAELLPHAFAEEEALYPAAARQPAGRLLVEGMLAEHQAIAALVDELETASSPVVAAAAGRALRAVFEAHLAKENELVVPLLAEAPGVDLVGLLAGMHELIGEAEAPASGGCGCGGCGCGGGDVQVQVTAGPGPE
ncbi:hemerythrin domain-containing protein [Dactylosporangium sp. NPDC049140]|uniref:hemerythrin domain-containing protein n=1 Tax=Dactylosporangium sp. NPDC049140 TaxID=3155647 RepID=UPI0034082D56